MKLPRSVGAALALVGIVAAVAYSGLARSAAADDGGIATRSYVQTNLVSDIPGLAAHTDPNLKNPWERRSARAARSGSPTTTPASPHSTTAPATRSRAWSRFPHRLQPA